MALRLTGTQLSPERPPTPAELSAQATSLLATGDCRRFSELFAQAQSEPDASTRFHARVTLVECGLTAATTAPPSQATQIYLALASALLDILAQEPREPLLLNYAGVAFYELWSLDAAREMFKAAQRLDPALPHLRRNLSEVSRRLRAGQAAGRRPFHTTLPALARRAKSLAAKAEPARGMTLSLCMIVRDEEEMLPRCLAAAAPAVDEIVIVDTGSKDRTIEIARSFGARVIEREWTGSFAEARNVSFEAATGDWLIYLDADEVLVADDVKRLRALTTQVWREAFYVMETSYSGEDGEGTGFTHLALRMFRNRPHYRFEGRLHEQIGHHLPIGVPGRIEHSSIRVEHYGYLGSVRSAKEKSRRNTELLRTQLSETPAGDPLRAFLHFNLGGEYITLGDPRAALAELERSWELVGATGLTARDWVPALAARLVSALYGAGQSERAIEFADEALATYPGFTDLVLAQGHAQLLLGRREQAIAAWERCLEMGDAPARYGAVVGSGTFLPLLALADLSVADAPARARELLERCLEAHPGFPGAVAPYAQVLLKEGMDPAAVVAEVQQRVADPSATVRFTLATALHAHGALDAAEEQYRLVVAGRPGNVQTRVTLAELLLRRGAHSEARELVEPVGADDPFAATAARIELWATVGDGALEALSRVQERAQHAGVSAAERDLFTAWAALSAGQAPQSAVPIGGTPLLGVILETLLARHDFGTFEQLAGLLEHSELPRREQQELLAGMYLRYGFLQSAAREWMAVCEREPDSRAMLGPASVAAGHGLPEDAVTFATHALLLDPACEAAQQFLDAAGGPALALAS